MSKRAPVHQGALLGVLLLLSLACGSWLVMLVGSRGIDMNFDDFFIVLVYGRHLNSTGSFFWNAQDGALDGFTSLLDVLVKASVLRLWSDPVRGSWIVTGIFHIACGLSAALLMAQLAPPDRRRDWIWLLLGSYAVTSAVGLMDAAAFLLEGPMFVAGVLSSLLFLQRKQPIAFSVTVALMVLSRPEGLAIAGLVLLFWLRDTAETGHRVRFAPMAIVGSLVLAYQLWHGLAFGYWAPNTYYAKASDSRWNEVVDGLRYLRSYVQTIHGALSFAAIAVVSARASWTRRLGFIAMAATAIVIVSGGDGYRCARFFALLSALAPIAYVVAARTATSRPVQIGCVAALSCLCIANASTMVARASAPGRPLRAPSLGDYICDREIARRLRIDFPGASLAQTDFQRLKFFSDQTYVLDLTGLNNRQIAHESVPTHVVWGKHDLDYGVAHPADLWILGFPDLRQVRLADDESAAVFQQPALFTRYFGNAFPVPPPEPLRQSIAAAYTTASYSVCGQFFNFLVSKRVQAAPASVSQR